MTTVLDGGDTAQFGVIHNLFGDVARRTSQALGERHDAVRLIVTPI